MRNVAPMKNFWEARSANLVDRMRENTIPQKIAIPPSEGVLTEWIFLLSGISNRSIDLNNLMMTGIKVIVARKAAVIERSIPIYLAKKDPQRKRLKY